jgi:hypothetical protein
MNVTESFEETNSSLLTHKSAARVFIDSDESESQSCEKPNPLDDVFEQNPIDHSHIGLIELILKNRSLLHKLIRDPSLQPVLISRFLAISIIGFAFFGMAMTLVLNSADLWPQLSPVKSWLDGKAGSLIGFRDSGTELSFIAQWLNGSAFKLMTAYSLGLIAATGVALPSLYFYGLLAGVKMSMLDVTIHALKAKATAAVALVGILPIYAAVGILPIYAAVGMGMVIFNASPKLLQASMLLGLMLPFIAGLWVTNSLYVGFSTLCDTMPAERRDRRECFLRRLVLSWSACYSAIMPVMIFTLWQSFGT